MTKRQVDKKKTRQVRIDAGMHKLAKIEAAESGETLRSLAEGGLAIILGVKNKKKNN